MSKIAEQELLEIFDLVVEAKKKAGQKVLHGTLLQPGQDDILLVPTTEEQDHDDTIINGIHVLYDQDDGDESPLVDE